LKLVFAGTPEVAVPTLRALMASGHEVAAVLTRPDAAAGRGRRTTPSHVALAAGEFGLETLKPERPSEPEFLARLRELRPDVCPVVAYGALVPQSALEIPAMGWVNLHFSLLPAWRGAAPVQHAVLNGDEITGATTFLLERGLDTGPCYGVVTEAISPTDTAGDVLGRLAVSGAGLLVATLDAIASGSARPQPQPSEGVSRAPKLVATDVRVDWTAPALRVDRLIRAGTPAPGAWTTLRGERVKLLPVAPVAGSLDRELAPGELLVSKAGVLVGTGSQPVRLGMVQPAGKRAMSAADWVRGLRCASGESFV